MKRLAWLSDTHLNFLHRGKVRSMANRTAFSSEDMARRGKEFVSEKPERLRKLAMSPDAFTADRFLLPTGEIWKTPAGAYKRCGGPS